MRIEHRTGAMDIDTERGFTAHAHAHRPLSQYTHWTREAPESNPLKLPTLCILRHASTIPGLEFAYHLSTMITISPQASQRHRERLPTLVKKSVPHYKDKYALRNATSSFDNDVNLYNTPQSYSNTSPPLWELGIHDWNILITI